MSKGEKKLISVLLVGVIIFSCILIYKIESKPKYNQQLYEEIYSEYKSILLSNESKVKSQNDKSNKIYMKQDSNGKNFRVAGEISIPKISISYPIIYETTEEYLKIAPAKLFGPDINEAGNLCIVGHNYKNEQFFSNLRDLEIDDKVYLTNNEGKTLKYNVYDKYEVDEKDLTCTSQETDGNIELTLITCTAKKKNRLIVKCRAIV